MVSRKRRQPFNIYYQGWVWCRVRLDPDEFEAADMGDGDDEDVARARRHIGYIYKGAAGIDRGVSLVWTDLVFRQAGPIEPSWPELYGCTCADICSSCDVGLHLECEFCRAYYGTAINWIEP